MDLEVGALDVVLAEPDRGSTGVAGVADVYAEHADFVWRILQRFGVGDADLEDLLQEVFVVVHRRFHTFDGSARMTTWLYGISLRVASAHRRRAYVRRERCVDEVPEPLGLDSDWGGAGRADPESTLAVDDDRRQLGQLLDSLDLDKRAVFVMFELEEMSCDAIAETLGIPVGTVYSRLHAARRTFREAAARLRARSSVAGGGAA